MPNSTRALYADRPEWSDVIPLKQYEGATPVAPIFYTDEYQDATDYLRGIIQAGEFSQRVLELTEHIVGLNPAHYTVWQYRFKTLIAIGAPLETERELMDVLALKFLKNYQVWHHRRLLLGALRDEALKSHSHSSSSGDSSSDELQTKLQTRLRDLAAHEVQFALTVLQDDSKNYHTWSYRQWVLTSAADELLWASEIPYVEELLREDIRNNSAWHHRFFTVWTAGVREGEEDRREVLKREISFTKKAISLTPNNPSAWNYLRGVLEHNNVPFADLKEFVQMYAVAREPGPSSFDETDLENPPPSELAKLPCPGAIEFLAEIYETEAATLEKATRLYKALGDEHDPIRKRYWEHRSAEAATAVGA